VKAVLALSALGLAVLWWRSRAAEPTEPRAQDAPSERSSHEGRARDEARVRGASEQHSQREGRSVDSGAQISAREPLVEPKPTELLEGGLMVEREPGSEDPGPGPYMELYQGRSGALSPNASPNGAEVTTPIRSRGGEPLLTAWVPSLRVQSDEEAVIHGTLTDARGGAVRPESIGVHIVPGRQAQYGRTVVMNPAPEGAAHHFEYRYRLDPALVPTSSNVPFEVDYVVVARGEWGGHRYERVVNGSFRVHVPGARWSSNAWQTQREGGDLRVLAQVEISRAGTYWAYAELWGGEGGRRPIAFARDRFENLPVGPRTIELTFGGLIIRESNIDGPYTVRNVRLMQVDAVPPQESEPVRELPPTPPWRASEFH
jgi:hypothetical protein